MFTLKLYRNGPLPPDGRTVILETVGVWVTHCEGDVKYVQAFKKKVGVMDEDGIHEFYVGGERKDDPTNQQHPSAITDDNYYSWGVLENAQGKTTEMFR